MKLIDVQSVDMLYSKLGNRSGMPIKTTYKVLKLFEGIKKDVEFYKEELQKIVDEYAERNEDGEFVYTENGQGVKIKEGKLDECTEKLDALAEVEVEVPNIKFKIDELPDSLSVHDLKLLMPFIEEDEEKEQD